MTVTYCFSYRSGLIEEQNTCIKSLGSDTACTPCRENTGACDSLKNYLEKKIVLRKYKKGAKIQFCAYGGEAGYKKDYQCLKGKMLNESQYIKQGVNSCSSSDCSDLFNYLKEKNN